MSELHLLQLDSAFDLQHDFLHQCAEANSRVFKAKESAAHIRLWGTNNDLSRLYLQLKEHFVRPGPRLCFLGSGDFHHVSGLLIADIVSRTEEKFTVLHFDNHPDWVKFKGGVHCGSWVSRALVLPAVDKVVTIGICSNDLGIPERKGAPLQLMSEGRLEVFPYRHGPTRVKGTYGQGAGFRQDGQYIHWHQLAYETLESFVALTLSRIATDAVYITIDKDVLSPVHARTNWDQGEMPLDWLLAAIRAVGARHKILGADVIGDYSTPSYMGSLWQRAVKRGEITLDQPRRPRDIGAAAAMNSAVNVAILHAFEEAGA